MKMIYRNYRGETGVRTLEPTEMLQLNWAEDPYHGQAHILKAWDIDKGAVRNFKLEDCDFLSAQSSAMTSVILERAKQAAKGYTTHSDVSTYRAGTLAAAGIAYACRYTNGEDPSYDLKDVESPWSPENWKPEKDNRHNLVKAIALLLAELEHYDAIEILEEEDK